MASVSGKIFIHLGLPKTATTTLQSDFFPVVSGDDIRYLGVHQPRCNSGQDVLFEQICEAVNGKIPISRARLSLTEMLGNWAAVIISEEMFAVSEGDITWRLKMKNLGNLLNDLDYTLILTVREPAEALFSYYVELNEILSREMKGFVELAETDERMHIFHYNKLINEMLLYFDRDRIFVKKFEDIIEGRLDDLCRLVTTGKRDWQNSKPKKHNAKKQSGGIVYTGQEYTLADAIRKFSSSIGLTRNEVLLNMKFIFRPIMRALSIMVLTKKKVTKPSVEDMRKLKVLLRPETNALDQHFGIKYD